jgi:hypothetical protein
MNCKRCREKILESLAAGQKVLPVGASCHRESCEACREFFHAQQTVFFAIDKNLRSLSNQPVPPSLLPSVRARLDEVSVPSGLRFYTLTVVAVTAAALLTINLGYRLRPSVHSAKSSPVTSVVSGSVFAPQRELPRNQEPRKRYIPAPKVRRFAPVSSAGVPEVIVLAEERQAFAKFVSEVPEEPDVAQALALPTPAESGDAVEIALVQIDELEVKPLEGTATE